MKTILIVVLLLVVAGLAYIRLAPSDAARWHTDPRAAAPGPGTFVVRPEGGDVASPTLDADPTEALRAFDAIVMATPRTTRLAGSPESGRITYVTRSLWFGFPDYTTVAAVPQGEGTGLAIHARLRFGQSDLGVNAARVRGWLDALGGS